MGTSYIDFSAFRPFPGGKALADYLRHGTIPGSGHPSFVSTNMKLDDADPMEPHLVASRLIDLPAAAEGGMMAVLSLMDPYKLTNKHYALKTFADYERALEIELDQLRRALGSRLKVVVCMLSSIPVPDAGMQDKGGYEAAATVKVEQLMAEIIGIDVYILTGFSRIADREGSENGYVVQNWAGDDVLVVPIGHKYGKSVEVVNAAFNVHGYLLAKHSGKQTIELNCSVPEHQGMQELVVEYETKHQQITSEVVVLQTAKTIPFEEVEVMLLENNTCVDLQSQNWSELVPACGCRVSQCEIGSAVADALANHDFGDGGAAISDFAVINSGAIRSGLNKGDVKIGAFLSMMPFLNSVVRLDNVSATIVKRMLQHSISFLGDPEVLKDPSGRYLQVSSGIRFAWYFEGNVPTLGRVEVFSDAGDASKGAWNILSDERAYSIVVTDFIAGGGDDFTMLEDFSGKKTVGLITEYEAVFNYLSRDEFNGMLRNSKELHGDDADILRAKSCRHQAYRVCQSPSLSIISLGLFCGTNGVQSLQQCDHAYHAVEVINNKTDGFVDELLPFAKIVIHETHVQIGCNKNEAVEGYMDQRRLIDVPFRSSSGKHVATIGALCSEDVAAITAAGWRNKTNAPEVVIAAVSTAGILSNSKKYPNLVRMSTSETELNPGLAMMNTAFGWHRVAIIHENTLWGIDAAAHFERAMLARKAESTLLFTSFSGLNRKQCLGTNALPDAYAIQPFREGCDPPTSFNKERFLRSYSNGGAGDQCDRSVEGGSFCAEDVLEELVRLQARIVYIAAEPAIQRHIYRALYLNRNIESRTMYGEGYAWITAWITESIYQKQALQSEMPTLDVDAAQGALGILGFVEDQTYDPHLKPNLTPRNTKQLGKYAKLWGERSCRAACCTGNTIDCKRAAGTNVTIPGQLYCDVDGNGGTMPTYGKAMVDAVLAFATAMEKNDLFRNPTPNRLYEQIVTSQTIDGITGPVTFLDDSGDRLGDLVIKNLQRRGNPNTVPVAADFVFVDVGSYTITPGTKIRSFGWNDNEIQFPGINVTDPPSDVPVNNASVDVSVVEVVEIRAGVNGMIVGFSTLGLVIVAFVSFHAYKHWKSKQPVDFTEQFEKMLQDGDIKQNQLEDDAHPREIKRKALELVSQVGSGKFGSVWKGVLDEGDGRPPYTVAAKTVIDDESDDAMQELLSEAVVMAQVGSHTHLVSIIGVITSGLPLVLVLAYCEHGSLLGLLKKKYADGARATLTSKLNMASEIANGMEFLASKFFVHRDLACRNVLVGIGKTNEGQRRISTAGMVCKIADFGLSRGSGKPHTNTDDLAYTHEDYYQSTTGIFPVRWTAPEAMSDFKFSTATDVWSFGIVMIEIMQDGSCPYNNMPNPKVIEMVQTGQRHPQVPGCPDAVHAVLLQCWDINPSKRPTFEMLQSLLEPLCEDVRESLIWGGNLNSSSVVARQRTPGYVGHRSPDIQPTAHADAHNQPTRQSSFEGESPYTDIGFKDEQAVPDMLATARNTENGLQFTLESPSGNGMIGRDAQELSGVPAPPVAPRTLRGPPNPLGNSYGERHSSDVIEVHADLLVAAVRPPLPSREISVVFPELQASEQPDVNERGSSIASVTSMSPDYQQFIRSQNSSSVHSDYSEPKSIHAASGTEFTSRSSSFPDLDGTTVGVRMPSSSATSDGAPGTWPIDRVVAETFL